MGENGIMKLKRGIGEVDSMYRRMYIPFLSVDDHWTEFNGDLVIF